MANIDRDPEQCQIRIEKRRELLKKLYAENQYELAHPALIEEEKPISGKCNELKCIIEDKKMNPQERKEQIAIKFLGMVVSILVIVFVTMVALMIAKLGH